MKNPTRGAITREKSRERRETQKIELRRLILEAASREFEEFGYEGFSLRRVAERIGYSATTIYLYFQNKDDLLLSTVKDGFAAFDAAIEMAAQTEDAPLQRLRNLGRAYVEFGLEHPAIYRLMFMQRADFYVLPHLIGTTSPPEVLEAALESHHRVVAQELLVRAIEDGIAAGVLARGDAVLKADALWASVHGLVSLAASPLMAPEHASHLCDDLLTLLLDGLAAK